MIKVLVINWRDMKNPEAGGAEIHIDEILKRKPENWHVDFVCAKFKGSSPYEKNEHYQVYRIPVNVLFNVTFFLYWVFKLSKNGYDLIIDDVSKIPLATPVYIKNIPIVAIHHHVHGKSLFNELSFPAAFYVYHMERFFLGFYRNTPLVVVSESNRDELNRMYKFNNQTLSYNGIEFDFLNKAFHDDKKLIPVIFSFGRIKKYKRIDHIIKALQIVKQSLPDAELWIAGKGDDLERLEKLAKEENVEKSVRFLGFVSEEDKRAIISKAGVFAITSEKEGWELP